MNRKNKTNQPIELKKKKKIVKNLYKTLCIYMHKKRRGRKEAKKRKKREERENSKSREREHLKWSQLKREGRIFEKFFMCTSQKKRIYGQKLDWVGQKNIYIWDRPIGLN
jgi:hypothetical protein